MAPHLHNMPFGGCLSKATYSTMSPDIFSISCPTENQTPNPGSFNAMLYPLPYTAPFNVSDAHIIAFMALMWSFDLQFQICSCILMQLKFPS